MQFRSNFMLWIEAGSISGALKVDAEDNRIMASLALALVKQPRANLQELAKAIGISKSTLYRFSRTREQLIERLVSHAVARTSETIKTAELESMPSLDGLRRLIANSLEQRELTAFLIYFWNRDSSEDLGAEAGWDKALDEFFLRGQQEGVFRIDIPAPALTEMFVGMLLGLVDAEHRGRVARAGLAAMIEGAFLHGVASR